MNFKNDAFTDAAQVDEMNRTVWKTLGENRKTVGDAPPESGNTVPTAEGTTVAGDAAINPADVPPTTQ